MRQQFRNRGVNVTVKRIGDWAKLHSLVVGLDHTIEVGYQRASKKAAKKYFDLIRQNIRNGGGKFRFEPLKQSTIDKKKKAGKPATPFMFYGYYYRAIQMVSKNNNYYVGIKKGSRNPKTKSAGSSYTIAQYASVLESGSRDGKIPARPLWRKTFNEMGGRKKIKQMVIASIAYEIRKRHQITVKLL